MKKFVVILLLLLVSCGSSIDGNSIVGKWVGTDSDDGTMIFYQNGKFETLDESVM